jgi:hypothetical protein
MGQGLRGVTNATKPGSRTPAEPGFVSNSVEVAELRMTPPVHPHFCVTTRAVSGILNDIPNFVKIG